ncbi:MAG: hypothetical protein K2X01_05145 [Cyanobacteria bacterium]|nr:hypothetical protein [Cyanobacteriota bacterium]
MHTLRSFSPSVRLPHFSAKEFSNHADFAKKPKKDTPLVLSKRNLVTGAEENSLIRVHSISGHERRQFGSDYVPQLNFRDDIDNVDLVQFQRITQLEEHPITPIESMLYGEYTPHDGAKTHFNIRDAKGNPFVEGSKETATIQTVILSVGDFVSQATERLNAKNPTRPKK